MSSLTFPHGRTSGRTPRTSGLTTRAATGAWRWLYATEAGVAVDGPAVRFATEAGAQQWLDRNADALFDQRIAWVSLHDGEHIVEGPLSLR